MDLLFNKKCVELPTLFFLYYFPCFFCVSFAIILIHGESIIVNRENPSDYIGLTVDILVDRFVSVLVELVYI